MSEPRKYEFRWELIGDIAAGRPNLGQNTRLEIYRLMQFTFRDVLERQYGAEQADIETGQFVVTGSSGFAGK